MNECEHVWGIKPGMYVDLYVCIKCGFETRTKPKELEGWDANDLPL